MTGGLSGGVIRRSANRASASTLSGGDPAASPGLGASGGQAAGAVARAGAEPAREVENQGKPGAARQLRWSKELERGTGGWGTEQQHQLQPNPSSFTTPSGGVGILATGEAEKPRGRERTSAGVRPREWKWSGSVTSSSNSVEGAIQGGNAGAGVVHDSSQRSSTDIGHGDGVVRNPAMVQTTVRMSNGGLPISIIPAVEEANFTFARVSREARQQAEALSNSGSFRAGFGVSDGSSGHALGSLPWPSRASQGGSSASGSSSHGGAHLRVRVSRETVASAASNEGGAEEEDVDESPSGSWTPPARWGVGKMSEAVCWDAGGKGNEDGNDIGSGNGTQTSSSALYGRGAGVSEQTRRVGEADDGVTSNGVGARNYTAATSSVSGDLALGESMPRITYQPLSDDDDSDDDEMKALYNKYLGNVLPGEDSTKDAP